MENGKSNGDEAYYRHSLLHNFEPAYRLELVDEPKWLKQQTEPDIRIRNENPYINSFKRTQTQLSPSFKYIMLFSQSTNHSQKWIHTFIRFLFQEKTMKWNVLNQEMYYLLGYITTNKSKAMFEMVSTFGMRKTQWKAENLQSTTNFPLRCSHSTLRKQTFANKYGFSWNRTPTCEYGMCAENIAIAYKCIPSPRPMYIIARKATTKTYISNNTEKSIFWFIEVQPDGMLRCSTLAHFFACSQTVHRCLCSSLILADKETTKIPEHIRLFKERKGSNLHFIEIYFSAQSNRCMFA